MTTDNDQIENSQDRPKRKRRGRNPLTGVRKLIQDRADNLGVTLADLSRGAGKNSAYVHQYVNKGTPKHLGEDTRKVVALMLSLDEDVLRDAPQTAPALVKAPTTKTTAPHSVDGTPIPLFLESQAIDLAAALHHAPVMVSKAGPADFAIWMEAPHGRIHSGDVAFVKREHPTRPGDQVIVLAGNRVRSIGEIAAMTALSVRITNDAANEEFQRDHVSVLKIIGVAYP